MYNSEPEMPVYSLSSETPRIVSGFFDYFLLLFPSSKQAGDEKKAKIQRKTTARSACQ